MKKQISWNQKLQLKHFCILLCQFSDWIQIGLNANEVHERNRQNVERDDTIDFCIKIWTTKKKKRERAFRLLRLISSSRHCWFRVKLSSTVYCMMRHQYQFRNSVHYLGVSTGLSLIITFRNFLVYIFCPIATKSFTTSRNIN